MFDEAEIRILCLKMDEDERQFSVCGALLD